jgi:hypothetical protein
MVKNVERTSQLFRPKNCSKRCDGLGKSDSSNGSVYWFRLVFGTAVEDVENLMTLILKLIPLIQ